jgi:hypothetical protein
VDSFKCLEKIKIQKQKKREDVFSILKCVIVFGMHGGTTGTTTPTVNVLIVVLLLRPMDLTEKLWLVCMHHLIEP